MHIVVDIRERALFDELKYTPPKTLTDYTTEAASRKCGIHLDGIDDGKSELLMLEVDEPKNMVEPPPEAVVCKHESHTLLKKRLVIGDVALRGEIKDGAADDDADIILFERKTLTDLASSIRDGRYKEQSFRMNQHCELSNHNIIYIIEGDMAKFTGKVVGSNPVTKKALYSAMFSMMYLKGFSVFRTANIRETADLILYFADKYDAVPKQSRVPFYSNKCTKDATSSEPPTITKEAEESYSSVFKHKERSSQITPDNIGVIMISAIPFVSSKTAAAIMSEYKTVSSLIDAMKKDRTCLNHICTVGPSGSRKISKLCVDNLFKYLN
jgi:crossover junction endonuclease MUS81